MPSFRSVSDVRTLESGPSILHVLKLPEFSVEGEVIEEREVFAIPVFSRKDGLLLALPAMALPEALVMSDQPILEENMVGPSTMVSVGLVMEQENGEEYPLELEAECLLVDFHKSVLPRLRGFDPVTEGGNGEILTFHGEDMDVFPCGNQLQQLATSWIEGMASDRLAFYSAEEGPQMEVPPQRPSAAGKAKSKASSKKVTTATLSEQLSSLAQAIPAISSQLADLRGRQEKMEALMISPATSQKQLQPHRRDFERPPQTPRAMSGVQFLNTIGQPPRARATPLKQAPQTFPEDEPTVPLEEQEQVLGSSDQIVQSLFVQQKALTSLVAHLTQDGLQDLGGATSSSATLSLKGSAKREKLQQDLAMRRGSCLLKVAQNAFRRLKPTEAVPQDLANFQGKGVFTKYLERQGGFGGAQRDLGLIMWLLCNIGDLMVAGDQVGAQELLALMLVAVEQTAQDGGKWEVGWLLSLQEDPPAGVFAPKPVTQNPRLRAFAPLCPPEWATTALAFVKEADLISARRQEVVPARKQPGGGQKEEEEGPKKPKNLRHPKKPKSEEEK